MLNLRLTVVSSARYHLLTSWRSGIGIMQPNPADCQLIDVHGQDNARRI